MPQLACVRCKQTKDPINGMVYGGKLGEEIRKNVCHDCWTEWKAFSIKVINEYRLDLQDPNSDRILEEQLRGFMTMPAAGAKT